MAIYSSPKYFAFIICFESSLTLKIRMSHIPRYYNKGSELKDVLCPLYTADWLSTVIPSYFPPAFLHPAIADVWSFSLIYPFGHKFFTINSDLLIVLNENYPHR